MMNKIKKLTKIFLKDYYQNLNIINKKNNKINKKSIYAWLLIILIFSLIYVSTKIISFLIDAGQPILFLKIYLPIASIMIISQAIILICNINYYSKDLRDILSLPVKPIEILIAKFNTILTIIYFFEAIILIVPLMMYGLLVQKTIIYFISSIIIFFILPIFFVLIISIIILFLMRLSKIIKNKNIFQLIVTGSLTFIILFFILNNVQTENFEIDEINKNLILINPIIKILINNNLLKVIIGLIKIIFINIIGFIIYIFLGNKIYLKNILLIINNIENKKIDKKHKYKKNNAIVKYIKNDIKKIVKNPTYFIQNIFQYICYATILIILINIFLPIYFEEIKKGNIIEEIGIENFKLQITLIAISIIQILFTFSNLSITAISREGKNAIIMKYIPISLYKQIKIKAFPQIAINIIIVLIILLSAYLKITEIPILYYIIIFITSIIINIINSYLMLLIDLKKPNLNWTNEESITKNNGNKLYQYIFTIIILVIFSYLVKVFKDINFMFSVIIINVLLYIILILLKLYIRKNTEKLFKKIY